MKKLSMLLMLAASFVLGVPQAQAAGGDKDYEPAPYFFVGLQGGGQVTFTNYDFTKLVMPIGAVSFGGYYNPVVGGRLHAQGWRDKGAFKNLSLPVPTNNAAGVGDKTYYWNYYTVDADLLVNLTNLFWKGSESHFFNLVLVGGVGLNYAWHNKQVNKLISTYQLGNVAPLAWPHDRLGHNLRVGVQVDLNVSKHFGINLECDFNNLSDRFNSKQANSDDWQATAMIGLQYKFGYKAKKPVVVPPPAPAPAPAPAPVVKPEPKPAPAPVVKPAPKPQPLKENIFYSIRSSEVTAEEMVKVDKVVKYLNDNPSATVDIIGYADVKTGNPKINMKYSQQRAQDLKNLLVKKGIDAKRIKASAKGDTEQPFSVNEKNRVSIITGELNK
jgi:outer membrane protein OmpA-like peptidoglycan-associated protein